MVILKHILIVVAGTIIVVTLTFVTIPMTFDERRVVMIVLVVQFFDSSLCEASDVGSVRSARSPVALLKGQASPVCSLAPSSGIIGSPREISMLLCDPGKRESSEERLWAVVE